MEIQILLSLFVGMCLFLIHFATKLSPDKMVTIKVLNPLAGVKVKQIHPVARPIDPNNKRIVLYWNHKLHSDVAITTVMELLKKGYPRSEFKIVKGSSWAPETGFYDEVLSWKPDLLISSTGD